MCLSWILLCSIVGVAWAESPPRALWQFGNMITCTQPGVNPFMYNGYGCYCGFAGSGSPIDQIDLCCLVHDKCYEKARKLPECPSIVDLPYVKVYNYNCSDQIITCSASNDKCQAAVCECDQIAANCFAEHQHSYNPDNKPPQQEHARRFTTWRLNTTLIPSSS